MRLNRILAVCAVQFFLSSQLLSQWQWISPTPTGQDINDISFASSDVGWFVGENGTIFKTKNGGLNWYGQFDKPRYDFRALSAVDENTAWVLGTGYGDVMGWPDSTYGSKILKTEDGGNTWITKLDIAKTEYHNAYYDLFFLDEFTGWICSSQGSLLKTVDGGESWDEYIFPFLEYSFKMNIQFIDYNIGYISSGMMYESEFYDWPDTSYSQGKVLRTDDGGETWQTVYDDSLKINSIFFLNPDTGWAAAEAVGSNTILKTINSGHSWFVQNSNIGGQKIVLQDSLRLWIYGRRGLQTMDGGQNWSDLKNIMPRFFLNADTGWGQWGSDLQRTVNGGESWEIIGNEPKGNLFFVDGNNGWAHISSRLMTTIDGGYTWKFTHEFDPGRGILDFYFIDDKHGWCVGSGSIQRYGYPEKMTSINPYEKPIPDNFKLYQNYPNPFNNSTAIPFYIPKLGRVTLKLYDILGRVVKTITNRNYEAGYHTQTWDGTNSQNNSVSSGIYLISIHFQSGNIDDFSSSKRLLYIK